MQKEVSAWLILKTSFRLSEARAKHEREARTEARSRAKQDDVKSPCKSLRRLCFRAV